VTSLAGTPDDLYETVYCARGNAENFIKLHTRACCASQARDRVVLNGGT
jgi:hypothetical protein